MKKMSIVITIPILIVLIVVAVAFVLKFTSSSAPVAPMPTVSSEFPTGDTTKPISGYSNLSKSPTPTRIESSPTPTPVSLNSLDSQVDSTADDGGASDFQSLKDAASTL